MTTAKARRRDHLRALARLVAQCRVNHADALRCGRDAEAMAWRDLKEALQVMASRVAIEGLPVQLVLLDEALQPQPWNPF